MTEDDTFRILSRPSYAEMNSLYQEWGETRPDMVTLRERENFFAQHKWTRTEYLRIRRELFDSRMLRFNIVVGRRAGDRSST